MFASFILKTKRQETPFFRFLHSLARHLRAANLPLPKFVKPALGFLFLSQQGTLSITRRLVAYFYIDPLFRGRCENIGKHFTIHRMPFIVGHAKIYIGDDVSFFGKMDVFSGRVYDEPKLIINNRVTLGHLVSFTVNKEIVIEDDVRVSSGVSLMDTDSHPRDSAERMANLPPRPEEVRPIRICKNAWIGRGAVILKGVTIGEGSIIGVNSVVVTDIPPFTIAMGNPARVVVKNIGSAKSNPHEPTDVKVSV